MTVLILNALIWGILPLPLLAGVAYLFLWIKKHFSPLGTKAKTIFKWAPAVFLVSVVLTQGLVMLTQWTARHHVADRLATLTPSFTLKVNGTTRADRNALLTDLKEIEKVPAHRSALDRIIYLEIEDGDETLNLHLVRDASQLHDYWVFYPTLKLLKTNEIGKITTSLLDRD